MTWSVPLTGVTVQIISDQFLPCPCVALCSELPGSGCAVWAAVACTPPEKRRRWSESNKRPLCDGETGWGLFWERRGGKKEEERLSHTQWEMGIRASERKQKFFTAAQRQIVSFKLCATDVRGTLGRNSPGAPSQLEAVAGFLGKWEENVKSSQTEHFQGNKTSQ